MVLFKKFQIHLPDFYYLDLDSDPNGTPKTVVDLDPHYKASRIRYYIPRSEGMRGLYRGVTPNTVGAGSAWGFYFLFYQTIKVHRAYYVTAAL